MAVLLVVHCNYVAILYRFCETLALVYEQRTT